MLVLAKAYPEYSKKYNYTICTVGITENGDWRRIYPIPFDIYLKSKYSKRNWIEYKINNDGNRDLRKESRKIDVDSIEIVGEEEIESVRSKLRGRLTTLEELSNNYKKDKTSLGVIRPRLDNFELRDRDLDKSKRDFLKYQTTIIPMFKPDMFDKLPSYKFRCCDECNGHEIFCEDIEAVELYRKMKKSHKTTEECEHGVKEKLFDWMRLRDLYFIIGTHFLYGTPLIISLIYPKYYGESLDNW